MPRGTLEVLLVNAKGLENTDFLGNMDPYVILFCRTQEQKSSVASGQGSQPEWNENFVFTITGEVSELRIKIMDSDSATQDDFVGEVTIPLDPLFMEGSLPPTSYNVVKDEEYCGEIRVGLTFTPDRMCDHGFQAEEESYGGWKDSGAAY
ncbi:elicitor-responsive protein 3 isoform X2 [Malania oleifera]|uniref:elicitor-responsive protein 3 isoform X2 n=1 Tax=Malania oleifera TaxID=397392 RepID=UPI0025AE33EB|nr:elicitor-responsive protein 3 isoform X2 [Malania oleifera]